MWRGAIITKEADLYVNMDSCWIQLMLDECTGYYTTSMCLSKDVSPLLIKINPLRI